MYGSLQETIGTRKFVRYIAVYALEGCPLSGVPLYTNMQFCRSQCWNYKNEPGHLLAVA